MAWSGCAAAYTQFTTETGEISSEFPSKQSILVSWMKKLNKSGIVRMDHTFLCEKRSLYVLKHCTMRLIYCKYFSVFFTLTWMQPFCYWKSLLESSHILFIFPLRQCFLIQKYRLFFCYFLAISLCFKSKILVRSTERASE